MQCDSGDTTFLVAGEHNSNCYFPLLFFLKYGKARSHIRNFTNLLVYPMGEV